MHVLVVGSIALDSVRTPVEQRTDVLGGSCTYFSCAAGVLAPVRVVSIVGEDFPDEHVELLKSRNIDLAGLEIREGGKTFRWAGTYARDMNDRTTDDLQFGVLGEFDPKLPDDYRTSEVVFLANAAPQTQLDVLDQMTSDPIVFCDTIDHYIKTEGETVLKVLSRVDGAVLNDSEAMLLTDAPNAVVAAKRLLDMGPKYMIVKKGEHGALLAHGDDVFPVPAWPLSDVVDPTGAGDAFAGGVMGWIARAGGADPDTLRIALAYGTATASYTCEDFSLDRLATLTEEDVERRVAEFRRLVAIP